VPTTVDLGDVVEGATEEDVDVVVAAEEDVTSGKR